MNVKGWRTVILGRGNLETWGRNCKARMEDVNKDQGRRRG